MFWIDKWLNCGPLQQYALNELSDDLLHSKFSDVLVDGVLGR